MDAKEILSYVAVGAASPVLIKFLEYLKTKTDRTSDTNKASYQSDAEDRRAWIKELQDELRILKACVKELEEENLKLERRLYKFQLNTSDRKAYDRRVSEENISTGRDAIDESR